MAFPHNIDFDRLANYVLNDVAYALNGWVRGRPTDETALLNRLTERFARHRRGCDVGVNSPVTLIPEVAVLHRQGPHQVDRFGADLAVTLYSPRKRFAKTAFFQLKRGLDNRVQIDREQLDEAFVDTRIANRSFVLSVDENRLNVRIEKCDTLRAAFAPRVHSHQFDTTRWSSLTDWLWRWIACL